MDDIYSRFKHLLEDLNQSWLDPVAFSTSVHQAGAPLQNCWGFIDGTARPVARPIRNQRIIYSGHKRLHCLKFQVGLSVITCVHIVVYAATLYSTSYMQSVVAPNGLIANMFGPLPGRRHDAFMLSVSGLLSKLDSLTRQVGSPFVIYGDPAYPISSTILAPYKGSSLTAQQQQFNTEMSRVRVSVEWAFGKVLQYFSYLDFKRSNKILLQPIGKYYLVATLLINCHTCLYGSQTSTFFKTSPPSLEDYLS